MVCDLIETGLGSSHITVLVNAELQKYEKIEVGTSCIRDTYQRLYPKAIQIQKIVMGNNDVHSH